MAPIPPYSNVATQNLHKRIELTLTGGLTSALKGAIGAAVTVIALFLIGMVVMVVFYYKSSRRQQPTHLLQQPLEYKEKVPESTLASEQITPVGSPVLGSESTIAVPAPVATANSSPPSSPKSENPITPTGGTWSGTNTPSSGSTLIGSRGSSAEELPKAQPKTIVENRNSITTLDGDKLQRISNFSDLSALAATATPTREIV